MQKIVCGGSCGFICGMFPVKIDLERERDMQEFYITMTKLFSFRKKKIPMSIIRVKYDDNTKSDMLL